MLLFASNEMTKHDDIYIYMKYNKPKCCEVISNSALPDTVAPGYKQFIFVCADLCPQQHICVLPSMGEIVLELNS